MTQLTGSGSPQVDLFLDSLVNAPVKDEQRLMEFPFFGLQKQPRMQPFVYDDGQVKIEISPGEKGIATIYDKDVLIYCASVINDRMERGLEVSETVRFAPYDFLRLTGRGTGKDAYEAFLDSLFRLRSTTIRTSIATGDQPPERRGFGWINDWRAIEREAADGSTRMYGVEVTLNRWMFRAVVQDRRVLSINPRYFRLTMALERRVYELARKHCGRQDEWRISLKRLHEKCGANDTLRKFKWRLSQIVDRDLIPDYYIELTMDPNSWPSDVPKPRKLTLDKILVCIIPRGRPVSRNSKIGIKKLSEKQAAAQARTPDLPEQADLWNHSEDREHGLGGSGT